MTPVTPQPPETAVSVEKRAEVSTTLGVPPVTFNGPRKFVGSGEDVIAAAELARLRAIAKHVWNCLGITHPDELQAWIRGVQSAPKRVRRRRVDLESDDPPDVGTEPSP